MGRVPSAPPEAGVGDTRDHGPRLLRLTYLMLPPSLSRRRRARVARSVLADASPGSAAVLAGTDIPAVRVTDGELAALRLDLVRRALSVGPGFMPRAKRAGRPSSGGVGDTRATERRLATLTPASRAAYVLIHLERLGADETCALLRAAGVRDPETSLTMAERAGLAGEAVRAVEVPAATPAGRRRFVWLAAGVAATAVAAPLVAAQATGGGGGEPTVPTRIAPIAQTKSTAPPASRTGAAANPEAAVTKDVGKDLDRIMRRLTDQLAATDADGPDAARILKLIAAVEREQQRVRTAAPK